MLMFLSSLIEMLRALERTYSSSVSSTVFIRSTSRMSSGPLFLRSVEALVLAVVAALGDCRFVFFPCPAGRLRWTVAPALAVLRFSPVNGPTSYR
jgi:hypothetical protein